MTDRESSVIWPLLPHWLSHATHLPHSSLVCPLTVLCPVGLDSLFFSNTLNWYLPQGLCIWCALCQKHTLLIHAAFHYWVPPTGQEFSRVRRCSDEEDWQTPPQRAFILALLSLPPHPLIFSCSTLVVTQTLDQVTSEGIFCPPRGSE